MHSARDCSLEEVNPKVELRATEGPMQVIRGEDDPVVNNCFVARDGSQHKSNSANNNDTENSKPDNSNNNNNSSDGESIANTNSSFGAEEEDEDSSLAAFIVPDDYVD